jgi:hypothetical protein
MSFEQTPSNFYPDRHYPRNMNATVIRSDDKDQEGVVFLSIDRHHGVVTVELTYENARELAQFILNSTPRAHPTCPLDHCMCPWAWTKEES